jgi:sodium-dependent phosphate transporter
MSEIAAATGNTVLAEQANIMLAACNSEAVPTPPISFNFITGCVNTVMNALNTTTFTADA